MMTVQGLNICDTIKIFIFCCNRSEHFLRFAFLASVFEFVALFTQICYVLL